MIKAVVFLVVVILLFPVAYLAAFGFYYGLDVPSGLKSNFLYYTGQREYVHTGEQMIDESMVSSVNNEVLWLGDVENKMLNEASGLAQPAATPEVIFAMNDSGNLPYLYAMDFTGKSVGSWQVAFREQHDIEDLASFELEGESYLLIADTGDNFAWRPRLTMAVVRLPDVENLSNDSVIPVEWTFDYRYPDGYRDCEAVAVDEDSSTIILISKRRVPAEVFELPLRPKADLVTARKVALLTNIPQPNDEDLIEDSRYGRFRSSPTALDIAGRKAVVFTYKHAYLFERKRRQSWAEAFAGVPTRILLPPIYGLEAGALTDKGRYLLVTGEREGNVARTALFHVKL